MNYQLLLEWYSEGTKLTEQEIELLELELYSQIESIKALHEQGCLKIAPDHICKGAYVGKGSLWISCLASVLDQLSPREIGSRSEDVFNELIRNEYLKIY